MSATEKQNSPLSAVPFKSTYYMDDHYFNLLHWLFGKHWMQAQASKKLFMMRFCDEYAAQFEGEKPGEFMNDVNFPDENWQGYQIGERCGFVAPTGAASYNFEISTNYFSANVSPEAAGIIVTLFTLGHVCEKALKAGDEDGAQRMVDAMDILKDYAETLPESGLIFKAID